MPPRNHFPLPEDLSPSVFRCVSFNLPDDPQWESLFWGSIDQLQLWNSYERSTGGEGKTVADVWKGVIDDAQNSGCGCACFDWFLINLAQGDCSSSVNADGITVETIFGSGCENYQIVHGAQINAAGDGKYHLGMTGQRASGDFVGGPLAMVHIRTLSFANPQTLTLTWEDCAGAHHTHTISTGDLRQIDVEGPWFCVECTNPFSFYIEIKDNYLCVVP